MRQASDTHTHPSAGNLYQLEPLPNRSGIRQPIPPHTFGERDTMVALKWTALAAVWLSMLYMEYGSSSANHFGYLVQAQLATTPPQLRDIGVVGLLSHDLFAWDSETETNTENGRVDLSTIFDYANGTRVNEGGDDKNEENAPVFTITMNLVELYKDLMNAGKTAEEARKLTVVDFHAQVRESFVRLTDLPFPDRGLNANVTNIEQAVFRSMHDILPGRARYLGRGLIRTLFIRSFKVTNLFLAKTMLNEQELDQELKDFDGRYDTEYQKIKIPFAGITINLTEADRFFIEKFSPYIQVDMLAQLAKVGNGEIPMSSVDFMTHATTLARKAICGTGNKWMPQDVPCDEPV